jgi:hypothetical protein
LVVGEQPQAGQGGWFAAHPPRQKLAVQNAG